MAYDDEYDDEYEGDTDVLEPPAPPESPEPEELPPLPPQPQPEPETPPPPPQQPAPKRRLYWEEDEEAPPLAPTDRTEAPQLPKQYAEATPAAGVATDAAPPPPPPAPAPAEPPTAAAPKRRLYWEEDEEPADGKKRFLYQEPEGAWGTFTRELLHGAPAAVTGAFTGAGTGAALGAAGANPLTVFGGAVIGGIAGGVTADIAKDKALKAAAIDDDLVRAANAKENPWAYRAGSFLSQAFGGSATAAKTGARVLGGLIGGGWETGSQLYHGKPLNAADILTQAAGGATFAGNRRPWIEGAERYGAKVGARFAPTPETPQPVIPGTPPANVAAPVPPEQGQMPWGAERQIPLPLDQPTPPPARPGVTAQPELPLEPPSTVGPHGQLGFAIDAPHPASQQASRQATHTPPSMPAAAGTSQTPAPPPAAPLPHPEVGTPGSTAAVVGAVERAAWERGQQQHAQVAQAEPPPPAGETPHSVVTRGRAEIGAGPQAAAGINVLQPGQLDVTLQHGLAFPPPPRTVFQRPVHTPAPPEPPVAPLPPNRSLVPHVPDTTQGVTEPPAPGGHTRLYQGERQPPNAFTTNRREAERYGPVKFVDVHNERGMPFFTPGREPGSFTTRSEIYRRNTRPVEELATQPVGQPAYKTPTVPPGGKAPEGPTPPKVKLASPELEKQLKAMTPEGPPTTPEAHAAAVKQAQAEYRQALRDYGQNKITAAELKAVEQKLTQAVLAATAKNTITPPKAAQAVATSKGNGPGEVVVSKSATTGHEHKFPYDSKMTLREALAKHGVAAGLMDKLTPAIRRMVEKLIGNMPVYFMPNSSFARQGRDSYAGLYHWQQDIITINNKYKDKPGEFADTILHEGIHGITSHALGTVPEVKAAVNTIMADVRTKHKPAGPTEYGFTNEREFVAEAFSNPAFQKMLAEHTLSPNVAKALNDHFKLHQSAIKTAWDALVQTVRKLLNIHPSETSALEAVMRATQMAIERNPKAKAEYRRKQGVGPPEDYSTDAAPPPGKQKIIARDKFGNEATFLGDTVHAAAAYAKAAGYKQLFHEDGTAYTPPKAAPAPTAPAAAPTAATTTPTAGGGKSTQAPAAAPTAATTTPTAGGGKSTQAPAAAAQQPAANVAAARQSILDKVADKPAWHDKWPTTKEEAKAAWRKFYTAAKNALDPIEQLRKLSNAPLSPEQDFAMLARLTKGLGGRVQQIIRNGTYDINTGKVNGKGLDEVIKPIQDNPSEFTAYALAKRTIELEGRGIKTGMNLANARMVVAADTAKFEPVFRDLVAFQDRVLENLVKSGVLGQGAAAKMRQLNKEYVPFYRLVDPNSELGQQLGSGLQTRNPIYRIKGSDKEVFDPIDSIIKNTYVFTDLAHRNQALVAMKNFNDTLPEASKFMQRDRSSHPIEVSTGELQKWMDKHGIEGFADETLTIFRPNAFRPADDKIRLYNNGKAEVYTVPPDVGKAVNAMDRQSLDLWVKIMATPARMLRAGAVLSPEFMLRNPLRDMLSAFIMAKHGSVPVYDFAVGLKHIFQKSEHYQEWLINGGANANLVSMDRSILRANARTMDVANKVVNPKQWLEVLQKVSELSENATRVGMYARAREKGVHGVEAAFEAREGTLDFARMGASTTARALNAIVPFFNAQVEGVDRAVRAFRDNPTGFLAKVGAGITTPSVLLWFRNKDDERVQQLPAWQRDLFWIVTTDDWKPISADGRSQILNQMSQRIAGLDTSKLPNTFRKNAAGQWEYNNGTIYRIPKPFEIGVLFGSVPERMLDAYFKENPKAFNNLDKSITRALVPNFVPQAVLPFMEQWANRSLFLDRNLLTEQQIKLPPAQQYGPYTSETSKELIAPIIRSVLGDKSSFGSPIIVDNYIRQWTGGLGKHVTDLIDMGIKTQKDLPPEPTRTEADTPLFKAFVARFPDRGAQAVQDFYDLRNERKMEQAGIKALQKTDPKAAAERMRASSPFTGDPFAQVLKADRDTVTRIMNDRKMTPDEKRAAIDLTYLLMIEHAKRGVEAMERTRRKAP